MYAVSTNFMPPLNHAFEASDVFLTPISLTPVWVFAPICVDRVSVGDQEERSGEAILVEDRNGLLELASQPVVESERNECWFFHCLTSSRAQKVL